MKKIEVLLQSEYFFSVFLSVCFINPLVIPLGLTWRSRKKEKTMLSKWLFDRIISLLGLLCLGWLYLVIAIMIKVKTGGPVFYAQVRVGRNGRLFRCHKFCTMEGEQEESPIAALEQKRITPIGRTLRHLHLDELPQLWDVFIGKMSFVGPRPDVPGYADKLEGEDRAILKLRPGITGPASLKYRNEEELLAQVDDPVKYNDEVIWPDKVRLNLYYLQHYSFWMDLKMIFATVLGRKIEFAGEEI